MTAKAPQNKTSANAGNKNALKINRNIEKSEDRQFAEIGLSTTVLNAATSSDFTKGVIGEIDLSEAMKVMQEKVNKVNAGDLSGLESTLIAQATSLDTMFNALARRGNQSDTMPKLEIYMRLALKAQAQCARTIEVLATMKNPPVIFAKQANITNGNQQVNNGNFVTSTRAPAHAGKNINQSNELLEYQNHGEWLDSGSKATTSGTNQTMATVETFDRR